MAAELASPFALTDRADRPAATTAEPCPAAPAPVPLDVEGFYKPGTGSSEVDPQAMKRYRKATAAIAAYENGITRMSDAYIAARTRDAARAGCVLDWLYAWRRRARCSRPRAIKANSSVNGVWPRSRRATSRSAMRRRSTWPAARQ